MSTVSASSGGFERCELRLQHLGFHEVLALLHAVENQVEVAREVHECHALRIRDRRGAIASFSAEQVTTPLSPRASVASMWARIAASQGARSESSSGKPALILATFAGG